MASVKVRHFMSTVAATGTRERMTNSNLKVASIMIKAETSNTGIVYVGDDQVSSSTYGIDLSAGDTVELTSDDLGWADAKILLREVWLDVSVSGDGVSVTYFERVS